MIVVRTAVQRLIMVAATIVARRLPMVEGIMLAALLHMAEAEHRPTEEVGAVAHRVDPAAVDTRVAEAIPMVGTEVVTNFSANFC